MVGRVPQRVVERFSPYLVKAKKAGARPARLAKTE